MSTAHVCGLQGFGRGFDGLHDTCPACEEEIARREAQTSPRVIEALKTLDVELAIARAARCCVPDVRRVLEPLTGKKV